MLLIIAGSFALYADAQQPGEAAATEILAHRPERRRLAVAQARQEVRADLRVASGGRTTGGTGDFHLHLRLLRYCYGISNIEYRLGLKSPALSPYVR